MLAVDTGNFIHELLQVTTKRASEFETEEELRAFAKEVGAKLLQGSIYTMQQDTASGEVFSDKLLQEGVDVAAAAYRQIKNSSFLVELTESPIDAEIFHGKVDRVDGTNKYVRVIDYKTGTIDDSAASYYTGQKIQLQLYMSELKGERIPAGVFYFPASVNYSTDDDGRFRMKGFINGDQEALICGDKNLPALGDTVKSEYFPAALQNTAQAKRVMDEETFRDFIDYSVHVARQGCKELREGYVAASPYDGSCEYCKYGGMCGFNKDSAQPRKEPSVDTGMIAKIARKKREGED